MPETVRITIELDDSLSSSLAKCSEEINNAVAAYAVRHRLLLEEVAAHWRGLAYNANGCRIAAYLIAPRLLTSCERCNLHSSAKQKAARAAQ